MKVNGFTLAKNPDTPFFYFKEDNYDKTDIIIKIYYISNGLSEAECGPGLNHQIFQIFPLYSNILWHLTVMLWFVQFILLIHSL